ncbi:hypothetical protein [Kitasatospora sp. NPDC057015]|uniref:hypothetical protein n=1 Tax=Kitasatospora sp. NPDC057015 TaxID=3346001 RepID=UPI003624C507
MMSREYYARLPLHLDERAQNRAASAAANMLSAAGFTVDLDPGLGGPPQPGPFVPRPVPDAVGAVKDLTVRLHWEAGHHEAATLTDEAFGPAGVIVGLRNFAEEAAAWCARLGHVPGDELADRLTGVARDLAALAGRVEDVGSGIAAIGSSWDRLAPSPRSTAARTTSTTSTAAPAAEPPAGPAPPPADPPPRGRTR